MLVIFAVLIGFIGLFFSFLLIGRCDCFQGQHTPGKLGAVSSEDDEDDFSPYGETSRDEAKEGLVSYRILLSFNVDQHIVLALSSSFNHHYLYLIHPVIQKRKEKNWPNQNSGDYGKRVFIRLVFFLCAFCILFLKTKTLVTPTNRKNTRKQSSFQLSDKNSRQLLRCSSQRSVIGTESLCQPVDRSNARLKPSALFSLVFSRASGNLLVYTLILIGIMCYFPLF